MHSEGILEECGTKYEGGRPVRISRVKIPVTEAQQILL